MKPPAAHDPATGLGREGARDADDARHEDDLVDEAGMESFPASDPPAHGRDRRDDAG